MASTFNPADGMPIPTYRSLRAWNGGLSSGPMTGLGLPALVAPALHGPRPGATPELLVDTGHAVVVVPLNDVLQRVGVDPDPLGELPDRVGHHGRAFGQRLPRRLESQHVLVAEVLVEDHPRRPVRVLVPQA